MAQKKARLFGGTTTLITYELDEAAIQSPAYLYELMNLSEKESKPCNI